MFQFYPERSSPVIDNDIQFSVAEKIIAADYSGQSNRNNEQDDEAKATVLMIKELLMAESDLFLQGLLKPCDQHYSIPAYMQHLSNAQPSLTQSMSVYTQYPSIGQLTSMRPQSSFAMSTPPNSQPSSTNLMPNFQQSTPRVQHKQAAIFLDAMLTYNADHLDVTIQRNPKVSHSQSMVLPQSRQNNMNLGTQGSLQSGLKLVLQDQNQVTDPSDYSSTRGNKRVSEVATSDLEDPHVNGQSIHLQSIKNQRSGPLLIQKNPNQQSIYPHQYYQSSDHLNLGQYFAHQSSHIENSTPNKVYSQSFVTQGNGLMSRHQMVQTMAPLSQCTVPGCKCYIRSAHSQQTPPVNNLMGPKDTGSSLMKPLKRVKVKRSRKQQNILFDPTNIENIDFWTSDELDSKKRK